MRAPGLSQEDPRFGRLLFGRGAGRRNVAAPASTVQPAVPTWCGHDPDGVIAHQHRHSGPRRARLRQPDELGFGRSRLLRPLTAPVWLSRLAQVVRRAAPTTRCLAQIRARACWRSFTIVSGGLNRPFGAWHGGGSCSRAAPYAAAAAGSRAEVSPVFDRTRGRAAPGIVALSGMADGCKQEPALELAVTLHPNAIPHTTNPVPEQELSSA